MRGRATAFCRSSGWARCCWGRRFYMASSVRSCCGRRREQLEGHFLDGRSGVGGAECFFAGKRLGGNTPERDFAGNSIGIERPQIHGERLIGEPGFDGHWGISWPGEDFVDRREMQVTAAELQAQAITQRKDAEMKAEAIFILVGSGDRQSEAKGDIRAEAEFSA